MKTFFLDPFEEESMSIDERTRLYDSIRQYYEDVINNKKADDHTFENDYNIAIECMYYEADSSYIMFVKMEYYFNIIYKYFQYSRRYIQAYEKISNQFYKEEYKEYINCAEYSDLLLDGELIHLNCESILLMVYSAFEGFLREFVDFLNDKNGPLKNLYGDYSTTKYMWFLCSERGVIIEGLYKEFTEIRLVRNYYAHSLCEVSGRLRHLLENDEYGILNKNVIEVNVEYIDHVFEALGTIVKEIEISFEQYYPDLN